MSLGKFEESAKDFEDARQLQPHNPRLVVNYFQMRECPFIVVGRYSYCRTAYVLFKNPSGDFDSVTRQLQATSITIPETRPRQRTKAAMKPAGRVRIFGDYVDGCSPVVGR